MPEVSKEEKLAHLDGILSRSAYMMKTGVVDFDIIVLGKDQLDHAKDYIEPFKKYHIRYEIVFGTMGCVMVLYRYDHQIEMFMIQRKMNNGTATKIQVELASHYIEMKLKGYSESEINKQYKEKFYNIAIDKCLNESFSKESNKNDSIRD